MTTTVPTLHCINQFFGGLGGEEQAGVQPQLFPGPRGPGLLIQQIAAEIEIVGTVVFGDNYVAENTEQAVAQIVEMIEQRVATGAMRKPELLLAGPAFNAGRYGMACCAICQSAEDRFGITAVTAMFDENPGVDAYRKRVTIVRCGRDVMEMRQAVERMTGVAVKLLRGDQDVSPPEAPVFPHGFRHNYFASTTGAERALEMLLKKLQGEPFQTEYAMPTFDRVPPAPAVKDVTHTTLALVTSGGIVPRGNPDRIPSASARSFGEYSLARIDRLTSETHQTVHGGYDPTYANADPNRVLPLDVSRQLENEGRLGKLYARYFATVGNATSVENARRFGREIAAKLINDGVQAVILTST